MDDIRVDFDDLGSATRHLRSALEDGGEQVLPGVGRLCQAPSLGAPANDAAAAANDVWHRGGLRLIKLADGLVAFSRRFSDLEDAHAEMVRRLLREIG